MAMQVPTIKMVRSRYILTVDNEREFSFFPEACIRGALGYLLYDWANQCFEKSNPFKAELCIRLYEALIGPFPNKQVEIREATPPKMGMLFITMDESQSGTFLLELTLFGDNDDLLHLFTAALKQLGDEGVGNEAVRYSVHSKIVSQVGLLSDFIVKNLNDSAPQNAELLFCSPTMLKAYGGRLLNDWNQEAFARNLYNRIELLCNALNVPFDYTYSLSGFVEAFGLLECSCSTRLFSRIRYSSRQHQKINCSGFTGSVQIKNVPPAVMCMLQWGEQLAVGKNTIFGAGRYNLQISI